HPWLFEPAPVQASRTQPEGVKEPGAKIGWPGSFGKVSQEANGAPPPRGLAPYTPKFRFFSRRATDGRGDQRQYSVTNCGSPHGGRNRTGPERRAEGDAPRLYFSRLSGKAQSVGGVFRLDPSPGRLAGWNYEAGVVTRVSTRTHATAEL